MIKNFYIFRNGQSSYNLAGRLQGQSNVSVLTQTGINQAFAAADFLKDKNIEVIVSSPQRRARQTGSIIAKQLHTDICYDSRIAEANIGIADGKPINKVKALNSNSSKLFKDGENKETLRKRVLSALNDYALGDYQNIAVSSHNFSILEALQGLKVSKSQINNGEIVHLQYDGNNWKYIPILN